MNTGMQAGLRDPDPRTPPDPPRLLIVRPDGYLGQSATDDGWTEADRYLQRLSA